MGKKKETTKLSLAEFMKDEKASDLDQLPRGPRESDGSGELGGGRGGFSSRYERSGKGIQIVISTPSEKIELSHLQTPKPKQLRIGG